MLILNRAEVTRTLVPVLGQRRAEIMASATIEELSSREVWISIEQSRFSKETGITEFTPGTIKHRGVEYRVAASRYLNGYRFFRKVRSDNEGTVIAGWFKRILYNVHVMVEPSSEECAQTVAVINDIIMENKRKC